MRRTPIAVALVALVLVVVLATVSGSAASRGAAPKSGSAAITSATLVCPQVNGTPSGTISRASIAGLGPALTPATHPTGRVTTTVMAGRKSAPRAVNVVPADVVHSTANQSQQIEVDASGSIAATLAGDVVVEDATGRSRGMSVARCVPPATDWWFTGADGRVGFVDVLIISNPSPNPAKIAVSLWGERGPHANTQLEAVPIGPRSTVKIPIASAAPDVRSVAVHVHATTGAVTAALFEHRTQSLLSNGSDFIPATNPPALSAVVPGFAPGKGARYLILTAPGSQDATVNLKLVTKSGTFQPSGVNQVVVRGGHSRALSISTQLGLSGGAVMISSDQPVIANGISVVPEAGQRPDLMWTAAVPPLTSAAGVGNGHQPDGGHAYLVLTAPSGAAQVRVQSPSGHTQTIAVPAGKSSVTDITNTIKSTAVTWPFTVTPAGAAAVYGAVMTVFAGAHGALAATEPLVALPTPIRLPPVREDPTVAVR
jgi:hypothetical protein